MRKFYIVTALLVFGLANAQTINIPDVNFKAKLLAANSSNMIAIGFASNSIKIDMNNDGNIQVSEAALVFELFVDDAAITDLTGIEAFTNLRTLNCGENDLTQLNLVALVNLQQLYCSNNNLSILDITGLTNLGYIWCDNNQLTALDTSMLSHLWKLDCQHNQITSLNINTTEEEHLELDCSFNLLTSLNVTGPNYMPLFDCSNNLLATIDLSNTMSIYHFDCSNNQLTGIDFSNVDIGYLFVNDNLLASIDVGTLPGLHFLDCSHNELTTVDISQNPEVYYLYCDFNEPLTSIITKNNYVENAVSFAGTPNLTAICSDLSEANAMTTLVTLYGYTNCTVNGPGICSLGTEDFDKEKIVIYPNPVNGVLNISGIADTEIVEIGIFNLLGQLVQLERNFSGNSIDVSNLRSGNYFIKIKSENATSTAKFIKD